MRTQNPPKTVLCIHDLSCVGRAGLSVVMPTLAAMGLQPVALPTTVLSSHTGGLGAPASMTLPDYGPAALQHYQALGLEFDCIYSGYLAGPAQADLVEQAHQIWPQAYLLVDPVLGDHGKLYSGMDQAMVERVRQLCGSASLILPNATEAALLLDKPYAETVLDKAAAQALAAELLSLAPAAVVTGLDMGKYLGCAGAGQENFVVQNLKLSRSFPGTGDLFGAVMAGCLLRGNALSAAADAAAGFVVNCIEATAPGADTRLGVWFETQLFRMTEGPRG